VRRGGKGGRGGKRRSPRPIPGSRGREWKGEIEGQEGREGNG